MRLMLHDESIADEPEPTVDEILGAVSRMVVETGRNLGHSASRIRFEVSTSVEISLGETPMEDLMVMNPDGTATFSTPGMYRIVYNQMGVNRRDLHTQEHVFQVALAACNEALLVGPTTR